eukprot:763018_1
MSHFAHNITSFNLDTIPKALWSDEGSVSILIAIIKNLFHNLFHFTRKWINHWYSQNVISVHHRDVIQAAMDIYHQSVFQFFEFDVSSVSSQVELVLKHHDSVRSLLDPLVIVSWIYNLKFDQERNNDICVIIPDEEYMNVVQDMLSPWMYTIIAYKVSNKPRVQRRPSQLPSFNVRQISLPAVSAGDGTIKVYTNVNHTETQWIEHEIIKTNPHDLVLILERSALNVSKINETSRIKAPNRVAASIFEQALSFLPLCTAWPWLQLIAMQNWLDNYTMLFVDSSRESNQIAQDIFAKLNAFSVETRGQRQLYKHLRTTCLQHKVHKIDVKLLMNMPVMRLLLELVKCSFEITMEYRKRHMEHIVALLSIEENDQDWIAQLFKAYATLSSCVKLSMHIAEQNMKLHTESSHDRAILLQSDERLRNVISELFTGSDRLSPLLDQLLVALNVYEWKSDPQQRTKDICVFLYDHDITALYGLIDRINQQMGSNVSIVQYNTNYFPSISVVPHVVTTRIRLYAVKCDDVLQFGNHLSWKNMDDHIFAFYTLPHYDDSMMTCYVSVSNWLFGCTWDLLEICSNVFDADRGDDALAASIKNWLQGSKEWLHDEVLPQERDGIKAIYHRIFGTLERIHSMQNSSKYEKDMLKIMKACLVNGMPFDFTIMRDERVLDLDVIDLLLAFLESSFMVTFHDMYSFIEWILTKSNYAQSGKLSAVAAERNIELSQQINSTFSASLHQTISVVRKRLIRNQTSDKSVIHQLNIFEMVLESVTTFAYRFSIVHHLYEYVSNKTAMHMPLDISIVLIQIDWGSHEPLVDLLKNMLSSAEDVEIIRYDVSINITSDFVITQSTFAPPPPAEGCIKLYVSSAHNESIQHMLIHENSNDLVLITGARASNESRIKTRSSDIQLLLDQTLKFWDIFDALKDIKQLEIRLEMWLNEHMRLFATSDSNSVTKHIILHQIFELLKRDTEVDSEQRIWYGLLSRVYLKNDKNMQSDYSHVPMDQSFIKVLFKLAECSFIVILKHQQTEFVTVTNKVGILHNPDHQWVTELPLSMIERSKKDMERIQPLISNLGSKSSNITEHALTINQILATFKSDYKLYSNFADQMVTAVMIIEWKRDESNRNKDISVFASHRMDIFHFVIDRINEKLSRDITYSVFNTDQYPNIRTVSHIPRSIRLATVPLQRIHSIETQLIMYYTDNHILSVNVYAHNHTNASRIVKSHLYGANFLYMRAGRFIDGFAQVKVLSSLEYHIKHWLEAMKKISTYGAECNNNDTQRMLRQILERVEVDVNMRSKYQQQVLSIMRACFLNGLPFNFMKLKKEMVLDRNVMDLLLTFAETTFLVAFEEMEDVLEWILTKSNYGKSGMLRDPARWKHLFWGLKKVFGSTLQVTIKGVRDAFVREQNQQSVNAFQTLYHGFQRISDTVTAYFNEFSVATAVYDCIEHDKNENMVKNIFVVVESSDRNSMVPLQLRLEAIVDGTNTEIEVHDFGM